MANSAGRKLFREFARHKNKDAKEFVEIIEGSWGASDKLITKDFNGQREETSIDYKEMVYWIIAKKL